MIRIVKLITLFCLISLTACSSSGSGESADTGGLAGAESITGTALASGGTPRGGLTVYLPGITVVAQTIKLSATDGTECVDPPAEDSAVASGCTSADGSFSIDTSSVTDEVDQIIYYDGTTKEVADLACTADPCELSQVTTSFDPETDPAELAEASLESLSVAMQTCTAEWDLEPSIAAKIFVGKPGGAAPDCNCAESGHMSFDYDTAIVTLTECMTTSDLSFSGTFAIDIEEEEGWVFGDLTLEPSGSCTSASGQEVNMVASLSDCTGTVDMNCGTSSTEVTCTYGAPAEGTDYCSANCE